MANYQKFKRMFWVLYLHLFPSCSVDPNSLSQESSHTSSWELFTSCKIKYRKIKNHWEKFCKMKSSSELWDFSHPTKSLVQPTTVLKCYFVITFVFLKIILLWFTTKDFLLSYYYKLLYELNKFHKLFWYYNDNL